MMTDTEMLDWLQGRYTEFRELGEQGRKFTLGVIGGGGDYNIYGDSLRECIEKAARIDPKPA